MPRKYVTLLLLSLLLLPAANGIANGEGSFQSKCDSYSLNKFLTAEKNEYLPILVFFEDRIDGRDLLEEVRGMNHLERRQYVIDRLNTSLNEAAGRVKNWFQEEAGKGNVQKLRMVWIANAFRLQLKAEKIQELALFSEVQRIRYTDRPQGAEELDELPQPGGVENPLPLFETEDIDWGLEDIEAPTFWQNGFTGEGVIIASMDTGCLITHLDLEDNIWVNEDEIPNNLMDDDDNGFIDDYHGWNFVDDNEDLEDVNGHGTSAAGILVGNGTRGDTTGVAIGGTLMVLRIYDAASSSEARNWLATQYAIENGARVVSNSLSYKYSTNPNLLPDYETHREVHENSLAAGMIQSNSVGNTGHDLVGQPVPWNVAAPANCPPPWLHAEQTLIGGLSDIIGIGAYEDDGGIYSRSAYGPSEWYEEDYREAFRDYPWQDGDFLGLLKPDIVAPSDVRSTSRNGFYTNFGSTSSAAPHAGGSLVLLRSIHQQATSAEIAEALLMGVEDAGDPGHDDRFGYGKLRPWAAHQYLDEMFDYGSVHVETPPNSELSLNQGEVRGWSHETEEILLERVLPGTYDADLIQDGEVVYSWNDIEVVSEDTLELDLVPFLEIPLAPLYFELISTSILPADLDAGSVFGEVQNLSIVYQDNGAIFIPPPLDINTIGDIDFTEGYQLFCTDASSLRIEGDPVDIQQEFTITGGVWNWIGYPFQEALPIEFTLGEIADNLDIVQTDDGRIWIPSFNLNTIDFQQPGEGYLVFPLEDMTFVYNSPVAMAEQQGFEPGLVHHQVSPLANGLPYTIVLDLDEALLAQQPAKVKVWDGDQLVGEAEIDGKDNLIPVTAWRHSEERGLPGFTPGHPISIELFSGTGVEIPALLEGTPPLFDGSPYARISLESAENHLPAKFAVDRAYPNPFNPTVTVPFTLPQAGEVTFKVFNILGQRVFNRTQTFQAGTHNFQFDASSAGRESGSELVSGVYFLQVEFDGQTSTQKIMLLK